MTEDTDPTMSQTETDDGEQNTEQLIARIEELEDEVDRLKPADEVPEPATDEQGQRWSLGGLQSLGLTRRQAMMAIGLISSGVVFREALVRAVTATPGDGGETVWGSSSNRDSYYADEIDALSIATEVLGNGDGSQHYTANYSGADVDARLDAALSAADSGDLIILEPGSYSDSRTGADSVEIGDVTGSLSGGRVEIEADWEFGGVELSSVEITSGNTLTITGNDAIVKNILLIGTLSVNADRCTVSSVTNTGTLEFQSGTSDGEAGPVAGGVTTTDNGSNNFLT